MTFRQDITILQEDLDKMLSIGQLRNHLLQKKLRLVVTVYSTCFSCWNWNITEKQVAGILNWGIRVQLSSFLNQTDFLESNALVSIKLDEPDWIDQKELFETLKQGIKVCIKKID